MSMNSIYQTKLPQLLFTQIWTHAKLVFLVDCNSVSKNDVGFSACFPYGINEGPCVFDDQCKDNLFCGYKNCPALFDENDNCCTKDELLKSPNFPMNYNQFTKKTWLIKAPIGSFINLQFHSFHVRHIVEFENT